MDPGGAVYADDSSVPRDSPAPSRLHRQVNRRGGYVVVEALVRPEFDEAADIAIRAAANGAQPAKWRHVERIVLAGEGSEARAIRNRLARATVVITDPLEFYREVDLSCMTSSRPDQSLTLLFSTTPEPSPSLAELFDKLEYHNGLYLLTASGVGRVEQILGRSRGGAAAAQAAGITVQLLLEQLKRSPSKVHHVATKATTLVAYEHNEQDREERLRAIAERKQFLDPRACYAWDLEELAARRVVFDGGHTDITDRIEQLRAVAARHLALEPLYGLLPARAGYVVTGDDREEYALQIADMAAGWAREIMRAHGLLALVHAFPLVLYNGRKLTQESAGHLDDKKLFHAGLLGGLELG